MSALEAGADINERDSDGRTALHHATIEGEERLVDLLLGRTAQPALADHEGWTPLHYAARGYELPIARRLLDAGAPVDVLDAHGNTPLFRAVFDSRGRGEMIRLLLQAGADRDRKNRHGTSPWDLAETISNYDVKQWFGR